MNVEQHIARLNREVVRLSEGGGHGEAVGLATQACAFARQRLGESHPVTAECLNNLAAAHFSRGDYPAAESAYREALPILERTLGTDHPQFAITLENLAVLYRTQGNYVRAGPLYRQSLAVWRAAVGEHHPEFAQGLNNLAVFYQSLGRYAEAERLLRQAREVYRKAFGEGHPHFARVTHNLASVCELQGRYAAAERLYELALRLKRGTPGESPSSLATTLDNLAALYQTLGNFGRAEQLAREALSVWDAAVGEGHPSFAQSLNNLAALCRARGAYAEAESLYLRALDGLRGAFGDNHPSRANCLNNLAALYYRRGDYASAEPLARQALAVWRNTVGEGHPDFAHGLNSLSGLYYAQGKYAEAEPLVRQALAVRRQTLPENHPDLATGLYHLAVLCAATGRESEALAHMHRAATVEEHTTAQVFSVSSERQRMDHLERLRDYLNTFLSLFVPPFSRSQADVRAALDLVLRRKAIGAEALAAQRDVVLAGRYPGLGDRLAQLNVLRRQIARKALAGPGPEGPQAYQQLLAQWDAERERLEADLARRVPEMSLERRLRSADRRAVARALPEGAALVEFVRFDVFRFRAVAARGESQWGPARYLAFFLPAGDPDGVRLIDLGEAGPIDRLVEDFRSGITGEAAPPPDTGTALRAAVFDPVAAALGGRRRLLLAPEGDLTRLPFEVLPAGDGRLLIDEYRLSYLGCGRDVLRFAAPPAGRRSGALVAADPDFDLTGGGGTPGPRADAARGRRSRDLPGSGLSFPPLPGTRREGERVADLLGVRPWLTAGVLETRLKEARSPHVLHLATHGFFLADQHRAPNEAGGWVAGPGLGRLSGLSLENPLLRSGLALAGAQAWLENRSLPAEAEDGLLTAEDVSGMDLLDTQLVVLSACETGLGAVRIGEGVFGLRRAFVLAGARALVMSLWQVPDDQTQELMEEFYRRLLAGEGRADALRSAQLSVRAKHPDPFFWGAFICQGDPGPLN